MSSSFAYRSLRPSIVIWIGLNCSCSSYLRSNHALRRASAVVVPASTDVVAAALASAAEGATCAQAAHKASDRTETANNRRMETPGCGWERCSRDADDAARA